MGGYPDALQTDDPIREAAEYSASEDPLASSWQLLLQIDSEASASILWGDVGRLYFVIRKEDLQQRRREGLILSGRSQRDGKRRGL